MFSIQLLPEKALSLNQSPIVCVPDSLTAHLRGFAPRSAGVQMDRPESVAAAVAKYVDSVRAILAKLVCVFCDECLVSVIFSIAPIPVKASITFSL